MWSEENTEALKNKIAELKNKSLKKQNMENSSETTNMEFTHAQRWDLSVMKILELESSLKEQAKLHWKSGQQAPSFGSILAYLETTHKSSTHSDNFTSIVRLSSNFVRFHEIIFRTDAESFIFLSWKQKKFFKPLSISKQKSFVYWPNFQWRFWF